MTDVVSNEPLRTVTIDELATVDEQRWLIRSLWPARAVGIICGPPKVAKTWLGLDLLLSVATSTPCLGHFPVEQSGPVLAYLAEDSLQRIGERLEGMAHYRGLPNKHIPIHLIAEPVRLDRVRDMERLGRTIERLRPVAMLLDPFVRMHRRNENDSHEISAILADLRALQQQHDLAVVLVHHARKGGRRTDGEALRGSGDLYAWGDAYAHLYRAGEGLLRLTLEHRYERPIEPLTLMLESDEDGSRSRLHLTQPNASAARSLHDAVYDTLAGARGPLTRKALRDSLRVNNQRLGEALTALEKAGRVVRNTSGWRLP